MLGAVVMCNYLSKIKVDYEVISERKDQWKKNIWYSTFRQTHPTGSSNRSLHLW